MKSLRSKRLIGSCFVLALVVVGIGELAQHLFLHSAPKATAPFTQQESYWQQRIAQVGGKRAYEEFAHSIAGVDASVQHGAAHSFGDALYRVEGLKGISVCDNRFSYGCYHQFLGRAILDKGLTVVPTLDQACAGSNACEHGIGHGTLADLGYTSADLNHALSICDALPDNDPMQGCDAGVFMEYNLRTMVNGTPGNQIVRVPEAGGLFTPCATLSSTTDTAACYFWQPQWWWVYFSETTHMDSLSAFKKIATLCGALPNQAFAMECIAGAGEMAPAEAAYDPHAAAAACEAAFSTKQEQLICRGYAANIFLTTGSAAQARAVCDGLSGNAAAYCDAYASGSASIGQPQPTPASL
jgi:hypothetical protein